MVALRQNQIGTRDLSDGFSRIPTEAVIGENLKEAIGKPG